MSPYTSIPQPRRSKDFILGVQGHGWGETADKKRTVRTGQGADNNDTVIAAGAYRFQSQNPTRAIKSKRRLGLQLWPETRSAPGSRGTAKLRNRKLERDSLLLSSNWQWYTDLEMRAGGMSPGWCMLGVSRVWGGISKGFLDKVTSELFQMTKKSTWSSSHRFCFLWPG